MSKTICFQKNGFEKQSEFIFEYTKTVQIHHVFCFNCFDRTSTIDATRRITSIFDFIYDRGWGTFLGWPAGDQVSQGFGNNHYLASGPPPLFGHAESHYQHVFWAEPPPLFGNGNGTVFLGPICPYAGLPP